MSDGLYKIVFKGEIGFDYDAEEVKESLQKFCGFDSKTVDRLFSGGTFVLKKNLDESKANRLCHALQKLGAFTAAVPMEPVVETTAASRSAESLVSPPSAVCVCPACGHAQDKGESCVACGIFFAKFARMQERRGQEWQHLSAAQGSPVADEPAEAGGVPFFVRQTAQKFTVQCGLLILALTGLQTLLGPGLLTTGFIILPVIYLLFIMVRAMLSEQEAMAVLEEHFNVLWERVAPAESRQQWIPWGTYGIILFAVLLYYGLALHFEPAALLNNFAFIPVSPNFWNVPLSAVAALFLHSGGWQLWGCVIFLWAVGPQVEKCLGHSRFLGIYLLAGIVAGGAGALMHPLSLAGPLHGIGSSGAIAGLLGFAAARNADRSMEFAPPLLDLLPYFVPLRLTIRLDFLAFAGLFFYSSLAGGIDPQGGVVALLNGHLIHIFGMLTGVAAGAMLNSEDRHYVDRKSTALSGG